MAKTASSTKDTLGIETSDINFFNEFTANAGNLPDQDADESDDDDSGDAGDTGKDNTKPAKAFGQTGTAQPELEGLEDLVADFMKKDINPESSATPNPAAPGTPAGKPADDTKPADDPGKDDNNPLSIIVNEMVTKGVLLKFDGFDGTDEGLEAAIDHTVQERLLDGVEAYVNDAFKGRPDQAPKALAFIKHLGAGGTIESFQQTHKDMDMDLSVLDNADKTVAVEAARKNIRAYYEGEGFDKTAVDQIMAPLEALGEDALIANGKTFGGKVVAKTKAARDAETAKLTAEQTAKQTQIVSLNTAVQTAIDSAEEILGQKMTKEQKDEFKNYMFKPTEIIDGKRVSKYYADRMQRANDPQFALLQGFMLHKGLKVTEALEQKAEKKAISSVRDRIAASLNQKPTNKNAQISNTPSGDLGDFDTDAPPIMVRNK